MTNLYLRHLVDRPAWYRICSFWHRLPWCHLLPILHARLWPCELMRMLEMLLLRLSWMLLLLLVRIVARGPMRLFERRLIRP